MRSSARTLVLVAALSFLACESPPFELTEAANPEFAKGGKPGKPGGGGDENPGPADVTILFDHFDRKLSYSIHGMDRSGSYSLLLDTADESGYGSVAPRWAPDGVRFVYERVVHGAGYSEIVIGDVDGTIVPIFAGGWGLKPDWSPVTLADGHERIAFLQAEDIYVMKLDGSDVQQLTSGLEVEQLVWSRDASQILAAVRDAQLEPDGSHLELFDVTCDGSTSGPSCRVTSSSPIDLADAGISPYDFFGSLDWAHGSDRVLVPYLEAGLGRRELGILDLSGAPTFTFVTDNPGGQAYNGAWSWDDSEIVYVKFPVGNKPKAAIVIRDLSTSEEIQIFEGDAAFGMDWRPTPPAN